MLSRTHLYTQNKPNFTFTQTPADLFKEPQISWWYVWKIFLKGAKYLAWVGDSPYIWALTDKSGCNTG